MNALIWTIELKMKGIGNTIGNTILMTFMNININMGMCSRQVLHTQNGNITLYIGGAPKLNRYMAAKNVPFPIGGFTGIFNVFVEPIKRTKVKKN